MKFIVDLVDVPDIIDAPSYAQARKLINERIGIYLQRKNNEKEQN